MTLAEFLRYVRRRCEEKGISCGIGREEFESPERKECHGYRVVGGKRHSHTVLLETEACWRRRINFVDGEVDMPCRAEYSKVLPYDSQTYVENHDGSVFNEICEFTLDDGRHGHGYYYQANKDACDDG